MKVFVTGATGFVGSAVVDELLRAGHQVVGLTRSDAGAKKLEAVGARAHRGDLDDLESLKKGAVGADAVAHLGFNHDFSKFKENCEHDRRVIEMLGGTGRPLVVTSGIGVLPPSPGKLITEDMIPPTPSPNPRGASEEAVRASLDRGANVSVVRLPPSTHGAGDHGFVPMIIAMAREKGVSAYIGEGKNRWPAVHRFDAAVVYRLALEKALKGVYYHPVADEGVEFREIAETIGRKLKLPVESRPPEHFTWFAHFAAMNVPASSERTREKLGWKPTQPGLIADMENAGYF